MKGLVVNYFNISEKNWWYDSRNEFIYLVIRKYSSIFQPKIIDIGCGCGILIEYLRNKGFNFVSGIDIEAVFVEEAKKRGNNVELGDIEKGLNLNDKYNVVILSDVLEHIEDDKKVITNILNIMDKDAICILFAPSFNILWSWHDVVNGHKRRYTLKKLLDLIVKKDVNILLYSYWNFSLFFPALIVRTIKRFFNIKRDDFYKVPRILNLLIKILLSFENFLILKGFKLPFGVSALCVFKKAK